MRGALRGSLSGSLAGGLAGSDAAAPASFMLDSLSAAPLAFYCAPAKRFAAYAGAAYRGYRIASATLQDIPYAAGTGLLDSAAQTAFFNSSNGFAETLYDQRPGARHLAQAVSNTRYPKVYDSAAGAILLGGRQSAQYDATNDEVPRADALGMSGVTAISASFVWRTGSPAGSPIAFTIGTTGAGQIFEVWGEGTATTISINISGARRTFTCPDMTTGVHSVIVTLAAGAGVGTAAMYWNGATLAQAAVVNGSNTLNLGTGFTIAGGVVTRGFGPINGELSELGFWNSVLSAGDRAIKFAADTVLYGPLG